MHVPPPVYFASAFGAAYALQRRWPAALLPDGWDGVRSLGGYGLMLLAGMMGAWGILTFWRHRTPVIPGRPARAMVTTGPYRFTRNPMYVGLFLLYTGLTLRLDSPWPLLFVPPLFLLLDGRIVPGEERHLAETFGAEYDEFRSRVRRWL